MPFQPLYRECHWHLLRGGRHNTRKHPPTPASQESRDLGRKPLLAPASRSPSLLTAEISQPPGLTCPASTSCTAGRSGDLIAAAAALFSMRLKIAFWLTVIARKAMKALHCWHFGAYGRGCAFGGNVAGSKIDCFECDFCSPLIADLAATGTRARLWKHRLGSPPVRPGFALRQSRGRSRRSLASPTVRRFLLAALMVAVSGLGAAASDQRSRFRPWRH